MANRNFAKNLFLFLLALTCTLLWVTYAIGFYSDKTDRDADQSSSQTSSPSSATSTKSTRQLDEEENAVSDIANVRLDPRYEELNKLPLCGLLSRATVQKEVRENLREVNAKFRECITPIVEQWRANASGMTGRNWVRKVSVCDRLPVFETLALVPFTAKQEDKWHILPKCREENVHVTFGIGRDTVAEEALNRTLPNTKFYGVDPISVPNRRLFSTFGTFFPFAMGRESGMQRFKVLPFGKSRYAFQDVVTVDFRYFLRNFLKLKKIDSIWFDVEGGELNVLDHLHRGGGLDQDGITVCQFNLEVHAQTRKDGEQIYHDFIFRVLEEQRYIFLNSLYMNYPVHRMFFLNIENEECVSKYFNKF